MGFAVREEVKGKHQDNEKKYGQPGPEGNVHQGEPASSQMYQLEVFPGSLREPAPPGRSGAVGLTTRHSGDTPLHMK
ncbi:hypothetical protein GCM10007175_34260 [Pseudarthrobacter scleromae]|uniref:Uncharacterized protein n=1 Tax=Pseudarthrobacter scleromae TaxID=158897 RepID=A0ABQ2CPN1_9MICC|nr:hypothetical protein GCM10007175_34260 [Pseudarthrobacter scleromae]